VVTTLLSLAALPGNTLCAEACAPHKQRGKAAASKARRRAHERRAEIKTVVKGMAG
jgi:hypothetical protein